MRVRWLFVALLVPLAGCATTAPPGADVLAAVTPSAPGASPLQALSEALGQLADNKLLSALGRDAADTLAWVATQKAAGQLTDLDAFRASQCPTAIQLATADFQAKVKGLQALLGQVDAQAKGLGTQTPEIILYLTKLRYGPAGANPETQIKTIKEDIAGRVTAVVDSCRAIIPAKQMLELLKLAGKAGLVGVSGGAALPLLGVGP